jgi:hypothetical protein
MTLPESSSATMIHRMVVCLSMALALAEYWTAAMHGPGQVYDLSTWGVALSSARAGRRNARVSFAIR